MAQAAHLSKQAPESFVPPLPKPSGNVEEKKDKYRYFIRLLNAFLNQTVDQTKFEDEVREIFGAFIHSRTRQLSSLVHSVVHFHSFALTRSLWLSLVLFHSFTQFALTLPLRPSHSHTWSHSRR